MIHVLVPAFFALTFILSSLILNGIQLICYLLIKPLNKDLFRRINYFLLYSSWSQVLAVAEWWYKAECLMYGDDETFKHVGKEHALTIMNHTYEVDWLYAWMASDPHGLLGGCKTFAKSSLKKLPIVGWAWVFSETIFLERNWEKDSKMLHFQLDEILSHKYANCLILLFCEGTRFTSEKHQASLEFAKRQNLPQLKYHLLPRTKGFVHCIKHLKGKMDAIYNVVLAFDDKHTPRPTMASFFMGEKLVGHVYLERIPVENIPTDSDEKCAQWLYELYQKKDKLKEEFHKTGTFPGKQRVFPRRVWGVVNCLFWAVVITVLLWKMLISGQIFAVITATALIASTITVMWYFLRATQLNSGSSYGKATPKTGHESVESSCGNSHLANSHAL